MKKLRLVLLSTACMFTASNLSGCAGVEQVRRTQNKIEQEARANYPAMPPSRAVVEKHSNAYLMGESVRPTTPAPAVLDKTTVFNDDEKAFQLSEIAGWIVQNVGVQTIVDSSALVMPMGTSAMASSPGAVSVGGAIPPLPQLPPAAGGMSSFSPAATQRSPGSNLARITMPRYKGTLKGFLDLVAAQYSVWWRYRDGMLTLFKTETTTFTLPSLPTVSSMTGSISTGTGAGGSTAGASAPGAAASATSGASGGPAGGQTSMTASVSMNYWDKLQATATAVGGPGTVATADPNFGTLTVTGSPPQIERVSSWVKDISASMLKRVAIEVTVFNIQVNSEENYGAKVGLAFQSAGAHTGMTVTGASVPTIVNANTPMTIGANILTGKMAGTTMAVQALSSLGKTSQVVSRSGVTLNGKMLALQAARVQGYLANTQTTVTPNVGATTSLQPGSVTVGFTGSFLPKVVNNDIIVDLNMTVADLLGITTISSGQAGGNASSIQVTNQQSTTSEQSIALKSGQTLVLTGYRQRNAQVTNNGVGSPNFAGLGGGVDAIDGDNILAVVITARLL